MNTKTARVAYTPLGAPGDGEHLAHALVTPHDVVYVPDHSTAIGYIKRGTLRGRARYFPVGAPSALYAGAPNNGICQFAFSDRAGAVRWLVREWETAGRR